MKKILIVAAAAGLMSVAACSKSPEATAVENNYDVAADNMDAVADNVSDMSNTTANPFAKDNAEAMSENMHDAADNVREAGEDASKNM